MMRKHINLNNSLFKYLYIALLSCFFVACDDKPDDTYSRNQYSLELTADTNDLILNEDTPYETALTLEWEPASDLGSDYIITYLYEIDLMGSVDIPTIKEYEDDGIFKRTYTHKELQDMLVDHWGQLTSTSGTLQFTVTASYDGPRVIIPEISTVTVKVKTYGPKQFLADRLFMSGTAVGSNDIEIAARDNNSQLFVYTGDLSAGTINFPIIYGEEEKENAVAPKMSQQEITNEAMQAQVSSMESAGVWIIPEADRYSVSVNLATQTVTIIPAGDIVNMEQLYVGGTAVDYHIEMTQTLEDEYCYAFRGELKEGTLYLPLLYDGKKEMSIVPNAEGNQAINDGNTVNFNQVETTTAESSNHWNITTAGTYRIVVNIDTKMITIYSPETDPQTKEVSWNNTVDGINPYVSAVEELWMYGGFNAWEGNIGFEKGYHTQYVLTQSLANPYVFVYKGDVLPRKAVTDGYDKQSYSGAIRFTVSNIHNNVYAYGSTADAERNVKNGYLATSSGTSYTVVEGQGDNRYAFFLLPENTNFVMVDIQNLYVIFDNR